MGGALPAIEAGFIQGQIQEAAYRAQQAIDSGESIVVGVNRYGAGAGTDIDVFRINPDMSGSRPSGFAPCARAATTRAGGTALPPSRRPPGFNQPRAAHHHRGREQGDTRWNRGDAAPGVRRISRCLPDVMSEPLLDVQHLTVTFGGPTGTPPAVDDVSFQVGRGETVGLVGESGSGKSVTAFSILRLVQPPGRITGGRVLFQGRDLLTLPERDMRAVRGAGISLIFRNP